MIMLLMSFWASMHLKEASKYKSNAKCRAATEFKVYSSVYSWILSAEK